MKKILTVIAALALLCSQAQAQGFLSKLKEKAAEAVGGALLGTSEESSGKWSLPIGKALSTVSVCSHGSSPNTRSETDCNPI